MGGDEWGEEKFEKGGNGNDVPGVSGCMAEKVQDDDNHDEEQRVLEDNGPDVVRP
jgi:hypothetical protein